MEPEYKIIEYVNKHFPDRKYYKCRIDNITYHHTNLLKVACWKNDRIYNARYYAYLREIEHKATVSFFEDSTTSKD